MRSTNHANETVLSLHRNPVMFVFNAKVQNQDQLKMRSFKSSKHINEKVDGPYRAFGCLKVATFKRVVNTKTSITIIQMGPIKCTKFWLDIS